MPEFHDRLLAALGGSYDPATMRQIELLHRAGQPADGLDFAPVMKAITDNIASGAFADEWDAESAAGYAKLNELKEIHAGEGIKAMEDDLMGKLGPGVKK